MKIKKLKINGFGKLKDKDIELKQECFMALVKIKMVEIYQKYIK